MEEEKDIYIVKNLFNCTLHVILNSYVGSSGKLAQSLHRVCFYSSNSLGIRKCGVLCVCFFATLQYNFVVPTEDLIILFLNHNV